MRVPIRKPGQFNQQPNDPNMTKAKYEELKNNLNKMLNKRPKLMEEVRLLAMEGDFSENAAYQVAKGRLRNLNRRIEIVQDQINKAIIIEPNQDNDTVQLGHQVLVLINGQEKEFTILGSAETNPQNGIISHNSPLGLALLGRKPGDEFEINLADKVIQCKILEIL